MTTVHFYFRVTTDQLEPVNEDQLPPSIRFNHIPPVQIIYQRQLPGIEGVNAESQMASITQDLAAAADLGTGWLIATIEDYSDQDGWYQDLKERSEAELRKDPEMYARYLAGGGFQPGKSLAQWRELLGGDQGEWLDPMTSHKIPVSLEAWAGRDAEQTHLALKTRTYWHVFDG